MTQDVPIQIGIGAVSEFHQLITEGQASDISYNNGQSGMTATDVQEAIDELKSDLGNIELTANNVEYDNTTSGLQATNVQGAVDEITDNLTASNQTAGVTDVPFRFGCDDDGNFGYIINEGGADTVIPFSKKLVIKNLKVYSGYGNIGASGTSCQYYLELDVSSYNLLKIKNLTNSTANAKCGLTLTDIDTSTTIYSKVNQAVTNFSTDVDISSVNNLQIQLSCYMRYEYAGERSQIDELDFL